MGIGSGDTVLIRANLAEVGRISGGADAFLEALCSCVGSEGTIVSLAFTGGQYLRRPKLSDAFNSKTKSYAGALPNSMLKREDSFRSRHPMCSYVAIGKHAEHLTADHDESSPAYEPVRKVIELGGKCMLVGCVDTSPGFTTTHLAEFDLGLLSLAVFPKLRSTYYESLDGTISLFRRSDPGMCSDSFYKFYALYVKHKVLTSGFVGNAYSIAAPAKDCYEIDCSALKQNHQINLCDSNMCFTCNAGRWDRIHRAPGYFIRVAVKKLQKRIASRTSRAL